MFRSSRGFVGLLLAVVVPPAAMLGWLGWMLLDQDRALLAERDRERREAAAAAVVHSLEQALSDAQHLQAGPVPHGLARLSFSPAGVRVVPVDRVLWMPVPGPAVPADDRPFVDAEALEFHGQRAEALAQYETLARSDVLAVRAGALQRIARIQRAARRWESALDAYRRLAGLASVTVNDGPADLQARRAICDVLQESGQGARLNQEARALETDLLAGRWTTRLDRSMWELAASDLERWTGHPVTVSADRRLFSMIGTALWSEVQRSDGRVVAAPHQRVVIVDQRPVTLVAERNGADIIAISPGVLDTWVAKAADSGRALGLHVAVASPADRLSAASSSASMTVTELDSGLPWPLLFTFGSSTAAADVAERRRLLLGAVGATLLLVAGSAFFLLRVMRRELAVARLQTEFVAAVSHEFRTPLTSLRHAVELLDEDDELGRDRRKSFYELLDRNTLRLHRLVESLLDFARMEGRRKSYDLRLVDAGPLVAEIVEDFRRDVAQRGVTIEFTADAAGAWPIRADAASLGNALWNLLDNAVKYSPGGAAVHVSLERRGNEVAIAVCDRGIGIPADEQKDVFGRFVRGRAAMAHGIKGTGLGLAIVSHIVRAHGGSISVDSIEGAGSTFTIVVPGVRVDAPGEELASGAASTVLSSKF